MNVRLPDTLLPGRAEPFGAMVCAEGVNFSLWSESATRVELCVFDHSGTRELRRYPLQAEEAGVHCGFLPGLGAGLVYGYRAHGAYAPEQGHRFNPNKLLLDPWAREIVGRFRWRDSHYGYALGHPDGARSFDDQDNAIHALKARVAEPLAPLVGARPRHRVTDLVLYEVHVKGFSMQFPGMPEELRGRYAALAHPLAIAHFHQLGVNTLALMPVHYAISEAALSRGGRVNYWGYNTLGFFSPDPRLGGPGEDPTALIAEFREMVSALHAAGIDVILDVVYNHTAESDELGPTLSFRGLDNANWYRTLADDRSRCENWSGCGNTLNVAHPRVTQFVLDSLRYWVETMGVDGFRFDLATVLGRDDHGFDPHAAFFVALQQDPLLAAVHLIAEPWDIGPNGYQVGRFPGRFLDWNDRFRDSVRRYWLPQSSGRGSSRGEFARRFCGSSDLFHHGLRRPQASVNFVSAHDGRTLADVVSYAVKHNQANGEDNRDGRNDEPAHNFGIEGPSTDPQVMLQRRRVRRALLATLFLAQGTPMLLAGDEHGNSQRGNNNAYCQDNPLAWLDWNADEDDSSLVGALLALRQGHALLRHPHWFADAADPQRARVRWLTPAGRDMRVSDWHDADQRAFACEMTPAGADQAELCLMFNPAPQDCEFALSGEGWCLCLDSSGERLPLPSTRPALSAVPVLLPTLLVPAQALLVLARIDVPEGLQ
ncbi:MAG: glycogen debranching protein GlgX [Lysobacterales bacterium]